MLTSIVRYLRRFLGCEPAASAARSPSGEDSQSTPGRLQLGWVTDVGQVRDHNEDTALVFTAVQDGDDEYPGFGLFVVADGMGGHRAGEVASSLAARTAVHQITRQSYLPSLLGSERDASHPALTEVLIDAMQAANKAVSEDVPGSGTTLICALVLGTQAYIAHVGDSRAYALTDSGLEQITQDHSIVERLIASGQLTREEAVDHPQRNVLYRAVGQSSTLEVETHVRKIRPGEYLLLCSDGLWDLVGDEDIVDLIRAATSPQRACENLVAAANEAGGRDNITAILWRSPLG